jgi:hypothetical protein
MVKQVTVKYRLTDADDIINGNIICFQDHARNNFSCKNKYKERKEPPEE